MNYYEQAQLMWAVFALMILAVFLMLSGFVFTALRRGLALKQQENDIAATRKQAPRALDKQ